MLQTESVRKPLWNILKDLQKSNVFVNYFLVGGTALSLQLGHRISDDIDLFTRNDINKDAIFDFLNKKYNGKYQINNIQNTILQITIDDIKVDFVKYNYDLTLIYDGSKLPFCFNRPRNILKKVVTDTFLEVIN